MAAIMEEQRVIRSCIVDEPLHCTDHIDLAGILKRVGWIIVSKDNHVIVPESISMMEELGDIYRIVDTAV